MVDRLDWIRDVLKYSSCPRCNVEKVDNGPESITSAFIDHISPKLLSTRFLEEIAASNIKKQINETLSEGDNSRQTSSKRRKSPSFVVFVDDK